MEYSLILEKRRNYIVLFASLVLYTFFIHLSQKMLGFNGLALSLGLLLFIALTPLVYGRYKLLLTLWIVVVPFFEIFRVLEVGGYNLITYFITGLTFPTAIILFWKNILFITKKLPYTKYLLLMLILILLNFLKPSVPFEGIFDIFKNHFITLFIIFCTYFYLKNNPAKYILNLISVYVTLSAATAICQKVTGIGMRLIEGIYRAPGLFGHPNDNAFVIAIYLPLALYLIMSSKTKKQKVWYSVSLTITMLALFVAMAKGTLITVAGMLFIIFLYLPSRIKLKAIVFSILFTGLLIGLDMLLKLNIIQSMISRFQNNTSIEWRFKIWKMIIAHISPFVFFFGDGIGGAYRHLARVNPYEPSAPHCIYLEYFHDYGVLIVTYFLNIFSLGIKFLRESLSKLNSERLYYIAPFLVTFVLLFDAITSNGMNLRTAMNYSWIILTFFYVKLTEGVIESK